MAYFLQQTVNGLHPAALYALLAYGYALVFGVTHRASFVQGALFAFAGQMVILGAVFAYLHLWLGLAASLAFGVVAAVVLTLGIADLLARRVFAALPEGGTKVWRPVPGAYHYNVLATGGDDLYRDIVEFWGRAVAPP